MIKFSVGNDGIHQQLYTYDAFCKLVIRHGSMDVTTLTGCRKTNISKVELNKPVVTLGSDSYPPYNYLNEDGIPTGIDVERATEAFRRMGYQGEVIQINWEKKKELVESGEIDCIMGCFSMEGHFRNAFLNHLHRSMQEVGLNLLEQVWGCQSQKN